MTEAQAGVPRTSSSRMSLPKRAPRSGGSETLPLAARTSRTAPSRQSSRSFLTSRSIRFKKLTYTVLCCLLIVVVDMYVQLSDNFLCVFLRTNQDMVYDEDEVTVKNQTRSWHRRNGGFSCRPRHERTERATEKGGPSQNKETKESKVVSTKKSDHSQQNHANEVPRKVNTEAVSQSESKPAATHHEHVSDKSREIGDPNSPNKQKENIIQSTESYQSTPGTGSIQSPISNSSAAYERYCKWNLNPEVELKECLGMLLSKNSTPFTDNSWYLIGDSTMRHLFQAMLAMHEKYRKVEELDDTNLTLAGEPPLRAMKTAKKGSQLDASSKKLRAGIDDHQCGSMAYLGFEPGTWVPPEPSHGEGPLSHGLQQPFCHDVRTSHSKQMRRWRASGNEVVKSTSTPQSLAGSHILEFLLVDYARDVELPTEMTKTTQATIARYLERDRMQNTTTCVVNAGLHDVTIPSNTKEIYVRNVRDYLRLIQPHCSQIIWIASTATLEWTQRPHRNDKIRSWNEAVLQLLSMEFPHVFYMDVWEISLRAPHANNIYLKPKSYYDRLAILFYKLMR